MKILVIGHAAWDITFPLPEFPKENTKNRVSTRVECGGGPAANAAYLLAKWGMDVTFLGLVGMDLYGNKIKEEMKSVGIDTTYLEMNDTFTTTSSFIVANTTTGTRTIITHRDDKKGMKRVIPNFDPDIILLDGQEYELSKELLRMYPSAISIIDAGRPTDEIVELSKMVTYLVCSKEFAETVTSMKIDYNNERTINILYNTLKNTFNNNVVVTLEARGTLYEENGNIKIMPSLKVKAIDSTGAGDIFHGAFTYGVANNFPFEETIKIGNIAGALSVTKIGSKHSIPSKEEMKAVYHEFK